MFALCAGAVLACPAPPDDLALQEIYVQPGRHQVHEQGMWAVWYNPAFFTAAEAQATADGLDSARCAAFTDYGMRWPSNIAAGVRFNVYLHVPGQDDGFGQFGWGNGVGGNDTGLPFMTLPQGVHTETSNLDHEGFHVFQWEASSPGFVNDGDSGWFIETSAQWFMAERDPDRADIHMTASAIAAMPHLSMWHGFYNVQPQDPVHWITENRQYAMHLFVRHLGEVHGLPDLTVTRGFFDGTTLLPQEYLARALGHDVMANAWADFAALMTASFVEGPGRPMPRWELTTRQRDASLAERARFMAEDPHPGVEHYVTLTLRTGMGWHAPPERLRPRPWSWNVVRLADPDGVQVITLEGKSAAQTTLRLVTRRGNDWVISPLVSGQSVDLSKADTAFVIVAWTPPIFRGAPTADYRIRIDFVRKAKDLAVIPNIGALVRLEYGSGLNTVLWLSNVRGALNVSVDRQVLRFLQWRQNDPPGLRDSAWVEI
jgi:hypothetical protein